MEPQKLKFAKRKLRVQRCKTLPGTKLPKSATLSTATDRRNQNSGISAMVNRAIAVHGVPKGDPLLGDKLRTLSKEERKAAKSVDSHRIARRLAKKKARNILQRQGVKALDKAKKKETKSRAYPSSKANQQSKGQKHRKVVSS
jgi:nucleolar protein 12